MNYWVILQANIKVFFYNEFYVRWKQNYLQYHIKNKFVHLNYNRYILCELCYNEDNLFLKGKNFWCKISIRNPNRGKGRNVNEDLNINDILMIQGKIHQNKENKLLFLKLCNKKNIEDWYLYKVNMRFLKGIRSQSSNIENLLCSEKILLWPCIHGKYFHFVCI